ncbi:ADL350Cp [Eremothecium gossypii ATCC 10895]|uniref:ADL350Cp n=1 Tax=Eremothecium gossypii (strain ATCC 10895 / CBS 109.51 / FGSC 9923 / NRRL Y-1056) TaxID=284811 RepID=Q75BB7_EREGS|nr:ADL350Cp [Eremothecium gossypii ATCC 10895]AAS51569.2 ADL350Cp [Eremothecium gossypii ATCC 10895]AEY95866.1 FADL350Cp [Eremothecium gossypii FDAG1]
MCGILVHYSEVEADSDRFVEFPERCEPPEVQKHCDGASQEFLRLVPYIMARGPDYASYRLEAGMGLAWFSSVLSLRQPLTPQSMAVGDRYILQFNGELFNEDIQHNDTQYIADLLASWPVTAVIRQMYGEFAYTIFDRQDGLLYFGRDNVGKRSLCYRLDGRELHVASVSGKSQGFLNCDAGVIYTFDVHQKTLRMEERICASPFTVSAHCESAGLEGDLDTLYEILQRSTRQSLESIQPLHSENAKHASVLFSGGVDCSVVAALICEQWSSHKDAVLELLNVAFENPRTGKMPEDAPDRKLAIESAAQLQKLFPEMDIRLVEVDVPYNEYLEVRPSVVDLIYPKQTEMDLSIAIAFYFAARGRGFIHRDRHREPYNRRGLVLFSGLGADELYGGYHKFANKSTEELVVELTRQINNIHDRNLNRDDKVLACHGVEARYPFLDEKVIKASVALPISYKNDKMILRKLARERLHLSGISDMPKRAIQFGARSAKMTKDSSKNGTDIIVQ